MAIILTSGFRLVKTVEWENWPVNQVPEGYGFWEMKRPESQSDIPAAALTMSGLQVGMSWTPLMAKSCSRSNVDGLLEAIGRSWSRRTA